MPVASVPCTTTDYIVRIQEARKRIYGLHRQAQKRVQKMMNQCDALQKMGMQCMVAFMPAKEDHVITTYGSTELLQWLKEASSPTTYKTV